MNYKLSPSDFAFLWEECKRCFYLKVVDGFRRPQPVMPKIFTVIDNAMKEFFSGKRIETLISNFPGGAVSHDEKIVESKPIKFTNRESTCFIKGKYDTIVQFDDGTYGVIDFKTSATKSEHVPLYSRQLHAYAYALENPSPKSLALSPVSKLGLIIYEPEVLLSENIDVALLKGGLTWLEIPRDDQSFLKFLEEIMDIIEQPSNAKSSHKCGWCQYREASRRIKG